MITETILNKINDFRNRLVKANSIFQLLEINKNEAFKFISEYHYLGDAKFFSTYNYGLYIDNVLMGVATYSNPQGISALKGWFGVGNDNKEIMELIRLCVIPELNNTNATSYLLGNSIKKLKSKNIKAVITLADDSRHVGSIYQVCNFKYYGLTNKKTDFYCSDGRINPRGETKHLWGVWLPRTQKHRYAYIMDNKLKCLLPEQQRPLVNETKEYSCCNGTHEVFDKRFNMLFTCPKCTSEFKMI